MANTYLGIIYARSMFRLAEAGFATLRLCVFGRLGSKMATTFNKDKALPHNLVGGKYVCTKIKKQNRSITGVQKLKLIGIWLLKNSV